MKTTKKYIPVAEPDIDGVELEKVTDCVKSGWISSIGKYVTEFEEKFSAFCGTRYGVACSNGTTALHLALLALNIGPGDEVICPTLTFIATANTVRYTGATPVFVDSERETWNMDPEDVRRKITSKTKAIIVVHLYGHPADMNPLLKIAEAKGIYVIEDAAEAHGALHQGKKVGSLGVLGCFSFYGNKVITTGEGGMVVAHDKSLVDRMRLLRDHAMDANRRYWHPEVGYNYRLTNLQAAVGVAQLSKIEKFLEIRKRNARLYADLLKGIEGIRLFPEASWAQPVFWMVSLLIEDSFGLSRDKFCELLREKGVDTRPFFIPAHHMPAYQKQETFPVADDLSNRGLNLPSSTKLSTDDVRYIAEVIYRVKEKAHV